MDRTVDDPVDRAVEDRTVEDPKVAARKKMRGAVDIRPADVKFSCDALPLLTSATREDTSRDDLLIVLQRERRLVERRALQRGLPPSCLGEPKEPRGGRLGDGPADRRTSIFESDVVDDYLPNFLEKVKDEELRKRFPTFAIHASDKYRDRLHTIARRERRRAEILPEVGGDLRAIVEYASGVSDDGDTTVGTAPAAMSAWVPSSEEIQRTNMLLMELQNRLDPFEFKVAELYMAGLIHQGDKGEIAESLGVSPSRIAVATARIGKVLQQLGYKQLGYK